MALNDKFDLSGKRLDDEDAAGWWKGLRQWDVQYPRSDRYALGKTGDGHLALNTNEHGS